MPRGCCNTGGRGLPPPCRCHQACESWIDCVGVVCLALVSGLFPLASLHFRCMSRQLSSLKALPPLLTGRISSMLHDLGSGHLMVRSMACPHAGQMGCPPLRAMSLCLILALAAPLLRLGFTASAGRGIGRWPMIQEQRWLWSYAWIPIRSGTLCGSLYSPGIGGFAC